MNKQTNSNETKALLEIQVLIKIIRMKKINNSILFFVVISLFISCIDDLKGSPGASDSIADSRSKGVFIAKYESDNEVIKINDTITLTIKEAWVEKKWNYGSYGYGKISLNMDTAFGGGYQMVIDFKEKIPGHYGFNWCIGDGFERYLRSCSDYCLISDFKRIPERVETWEVHSGGDMEAKLGKNVIGIFSLTQRQ